MDDSDTRARRSAHVINQDGIEWAAETSPDGRSAFFRKKLGAAAGGRHLGCTLMKLLPGNRSWPRHYHTANEEAVYVLSGSGKLRLGDKELPISVGDYVALLPGEDGAHQIINDSDSTLVYLCFSTMIEPDVVVYPDSNKVGVFVGAAPGGPTEKRKMKMFFGLNVAREYWDDE